MRQLLALLVLLAAGCSGCASLPTHNDLRATTLRLQFGDVICSGTAVARDVVLTAQHCWQKTPEIRVNGQLAQVVGIGRSGKDTLALRVKGVVFEHWAMTGPQPNQGDHVRWWGNPLGLEDMYREGYVARSWSDGILIVANICRGDSGAGLFDSRGRVVGVITGMSDNNGCTFMVSYPPR